MKWIARQAIAVLGGVLAAILCVEPAGAVDGVVEINQARAMAGGITSGDTAGFPVVISEPGSYRLTGNLDVGIAVDGIVVQAAGVTLDLNGFEIVGTNSCSGNPPETGITCDSTGGTIGIRAEEPNLTVRNGGVRNFQSTNIYCYTQGCLLEDIHVQEAGVGITTSGSAVIRGCTAERNSHAGILPIPGEVPGLVIENNVARENGASGIVGGGNGIVRANVSYANFGDGIVAIGGTFVGNLVYDNHVDGLDLDAGTVLDNVSTDNAGYGLKLASTGTTGYGGNFFRNNTAGSLSGTGLQLSTNMCGSAACP